MTKDELCLLRFVISFLTWLVFCLLLVLFVSSLVLHSLLSAAYHPVFDLQLVIVSYFRKLCCGLFRLVLCFTYLILCISIFVRLVDLPSIHSSRHKEKFCASVLTFLVLFLILPVESIYNYLATLSINMTCSYVRL